MKLFPKYGKLISIFVLVAVVVSSFLVAVNLINPTPIEACHDQGCNVLFWKDHTARWSGYEPDQALRILFSVADKYQLGDTTLLEALGFNWFFGGSASVIAAKILLREGVAARLNASHPDIDYHISGSQVIQMVNDALASGNPLTMLRVAGSLAMWNNAGCPFCQPPHHH
jgi:hypothetical protein